MTITFERQVVPEKERNQMTEDQSDTQNSDRKKVTYKVIIVAIAGCLMYGILSGFRMDLSILIGIINQSQSSMTYTDLQIANSVFYLVSAFASPVVAFLVLKRSNFFVLTMGFILTLTGIGIISVADNLALMIIGHGILYAVGSAALSFGIIFGILSPLFGEKTAIIISTLMVIVSNIFSVIFSPVIQYISDILGYQVMLWIFCIVVVACYPLALLISGKKYEVVSAKEKESMRFRDALSIILKNKITYILILICFSHGFIFSVVCNHFYTGLGDLGATPMNTSVIISLLNLVMAFYSLVFAFVVLKVKRPLRFGIIIFFVMSIALFLIIYHTRGSFFFFIAITSSLILMQAVYPLCNLVSRRAFSPILLGSVICFTSFFTKVGSSLNAILGSIIFKEFGNFIPLVILEMSVAATVMVVLFIFALKSKNLHIDTCAESEDEKAK